MNEENKIEYPEPHHFGKELRELKDKGNELYNDMKFAEEVSRNEYKEAMNHLIAMGKSHTAFHERVKELAELMVKIENLAEQPLF